MQGFASSAMLDCGAAHQHLMSASSGQHNTHLAQGQQIHHHEQVSASQHHVADASHATSGDSSTDDSHHHGADKCSACASCCLSTAISAPAALDPVAPLPAGLETGLQADQQFTAHFPEGLERPPHSLAI
ncbi:hypothetical protein [Collimonas fungivorans]|uniref:hypothetical protein n=1 Tax=Collimonas fungivorans TaxID=158899 RepID=UPI0026F0C648|nr:hypothetical protein [Collimonas fungivorans]